MSLIDLPPEKIYEICEKVDDRTLAAIVQTHSFIKETCQEILNKRKERKEFDDLIKLLVGKWIKINTDGGRRYESVKVEVEDLGNSIKIPRSDEFIIEGMSGILIWGLHKNRPDYWTITIPKDDVEKLKRLYNNLVEMGYIKRNGLPFASEMKDSLITLEDYSVGGKGYNYMTSMQRDELFPILQRLGVSTVGNESQIQLRGMIIQRLKEIGRFFPAE